MAVLVNGNEIVLSGTVGNLFWEDCFDAADVIMALAQVGRGQDVVVRLNSGGGIATEGAAIHAALAAHGGKVTIIVEGVAASAASVIAMAGDEVVMALGSVMMIHDPSGFTFGPVDEHELAIRMLNALATSMAGIYADKTGKTVDQARADMRAEVWLTPEEAVAAKYADRVQARPAANDDAPLPAEPQPTAFDYRLYQHPPDRIVALADANAWRRSKPGMAAAAAPPTAHRREPTMTTAPAPGAAPPPAGPGQQALTAAVEEGKAQASATSLPHAQAGEVADLCLAGGVPEMTASLLREGVTVDQAKARITQAGEIKDAVALARRRNPEIPETFAATMIAEGKTLEQVRSELFGKLAARDEAAPVTSQHVAPGATAGRKSATSSMQRELDRAGLSKKGA